MAHTVIYLILLGKFYFFIIASGKTRIINLQMEPLYVKAGQPLKLVCEQTEGFKTTWLRFLKSKSTTELPGESTNKYKPITSEDSFIQKFSSKDGRYLNVVFKRIAESADSGSYCCNVLNNLDRSYYFDVNVFEVVNHDGMMLKNGIDIKIACQFTAESKVFPTITWYRKNKEIPSTAKVGKYSINFTSSEHTFISYLVIHKTNEHDAGIYDCRIKLANNATFVHSAHVMSAPLVKIIEKSVSILEHDDTRVVCWVSGWPIPKVQWLRGLHNSTLVHNSSETIDKQHKKERIYAENCLDDDASNKNMLEKHDHQFSLLSSKTYISVQNASDELLEDERNSSTTVAAGNNASLGSLSKSGHSTLFIIDTRISDRNMYVCEASVTVNGTATLKSRAFVLIRVKGRYAFLLPFAGVILEFVILIIIILIYEKNKKRNLINIENNEENNIFQPLVGQSNEKGGRSRK